MMRANENSNFRPAEVDQGAASVTWKTCLRAVSMQRRHIQTAESGRTGIVVAKPGTSATGRGRDGCNAYGNYAKSKQSVLEPNNLAESRRRALAQIRQL